MTRFRSVKNNSTRTVSITLIIQVARSIILWIKTTVVVASANVEYFLVTMTVVAMIDTDVATQI